MKKSEKNRTLLLHLMQIFLSFFNLHKKEREATASPSSTPSRNRTGTTFTGHRILSPACLPIPPSGRGVKNVPL